MEAFVVLRFEALGVFVMRLGVVDDAGGGHSNDRAGCCNDTGGGVDTAIEGAGAGAGVGLDFLGNRPLSVVALLAAVVFFGAAQSASQELLLLSVPFPVAFTLSFAGPLSAIVFMSSETGSTSFTTTPRFSSIFLQKIKVRKAHLKPTLQALSIVAIIRLDFRWMIENSVAQRQEITEMKL